MVVEVPRGEVPGSVLGVGSMLDATRFYEYAP
jgi:hypothetical protein